MLEKMRKKQMLAAMKKSTMGILLLCFSLMSLEGKTPMKKVSFEPRAWNELEFNWDGHVWRIVDNPCSPKLDMWERKAVSINIPERIRVSKKGVAKIPVPVCVSFCIPDNRYYKYCSDPKYEKIIHVKCLDETESAFLHYPIEEHMSKYYTEHFQDAVTPALYLLLEKAEKERLEMIQKCKELPDEMIDEGPAQGWYLTFNLSEYMDEPLQCGRYEIYFTYRGLESEHRIVKIAYKR